MSEIICHISSVHASGDPRIRLKQLRSIQNVYPKVFFVTADTSAAYDEKESNGFEIIKVKAWSNNRFFRVLVTGLLCVVQALKTRSDIYHIHDPELLLWAWLLRLTGSAVVYDIHEDYVTSIKQKSYIPRGVRAFAGALSGFCEKLLSSFCYKVIAEDYYSRRFPSAVQVLNYPVLKDLLPVSAFSSSSCSVIYTGNVTVDRGALLMSKFHALSDRYDVTFVGRCSENLYKSIAENSQLQGKQCPEVNGVGHFVEFRGIIESYARGSWLAGIAVFPDTEHYREKALTKFFEYMAVGLPIIASNFPVWKSIVEDRGVGICVPPEDNQAIEDALDWLRQNPKAASIMSKKGKELAESRYSWESQAKNLIDLYGKIIEQKKGPGNTSGNP